MPETDLKILKSAYFFFKTFWSRFLQLLCRLKIMPMTQIPHFLLIVWQKNREIFSQTNPFNMNTNLKENMRRQKPIWLISKGKKTNKQKNRIQIANKTKLHLRFYRQLRIKL